MAFRPHLRSLRIHVDRIDSIQGEEKTIAIFHASCSNAKKQEEFHWERFRPNDAVSRVMKHLVFFRDFSSLCDCALLPLDTAVQDARGRISGTSFELLHYNNDNISVAYTKLWNSTNAFAVCGVQNVLHFNMMTLKITSSVLSIVISGITSRESTALPLY